MRKILPSGSNGSSSGGAPQQIFLLLCGLHVRAVVLIVSMRTQRQVVMHVDVTYSSGFLRSSCRRQKVTHQRFGVRWCGLRLRATARGGRVPLER